MVENKSYGDIVATEVDPQFIKGMEERMVMSYHKYGAIAEGAPKMDSMANVLARLRMYTVGDPAKGIKPGNTEYLMDAANFAMIEYMYPKHPDAHFASGDDDASPGRVSSKTGKLDKRDNKEIGGGAYSSPMRNFRD